MMDFVLNSNISATSAVENGSSDVISFQCKSEVPTTYELITDHEISLWTYSMFGVYSVCCLISLIIYTDEVVFVVKRFRKGARLKKTIWILTFFPAFTLTSYIGIIVPRAGTLVDLVSNVFFVTCLYQFVGLMENYLGGNEQMWTILGESRKISIATGPLCCCCRCCLPQILLTRQNYHRITLLVVQVTALRPILVFIAAVLWTNGSYIPGNLAPSNAFLYIAILNLISSLMGTWGLMILKNAFLKELGSTYRLTGKIGCLQLSLLSTAIVTIVIGVLVTTDAIQCTAFYPSKSRAEAIYHGILVVMMCFYGFVARFFFRRLEDATDLCYPSKLLEDDDRRPKRTSPSASNHVISDVIDVNNDVTDQMC